MAETVADGVDAADRVADFETLIAELSSRFVNLPPSEVDREIGEVLRRVCTQFGIELAVLWQWSSASPGVIVPTHFHYAQAGRQPPEPLDQRQFPWYAQQMLAGRLTVVASLDDLPPEAAVDRESCRLFGVRSNLSLPLALGGEPPVGALGLNTLARERDWPGASVRRLQLVAQLITSALGRKRADEALRADEVRLQAGADLAGLAYYAVDFRAGTFELDRRGRDLLGVDPDLAGSLRLLQLWMERLHPDDRPRVLDLREQLHSGKMKRTELEYRYLHPVRGEIWIDHLAAAAERDADGRTVRSFGVLRDIGHQKRAEIELRDMSQRLLQAQERERALIARELHDDLTQRLAVLAIDAGRAEAAAVDPGLAGTLRALREQLVRVSEDVHAIAYQLHPSILEELGLAEALRAEVERRRRQSRLDIALALEPLPDGIGRETELCLFRVAQEALHNAIRHAGASRASVRLRPQDGGLLLAVSDDGVGFEPATPKAGRHLGLASMRERMRSVNGTVDIDSAPGSGTTVVAWAPVGDGPR